MERVLLYREENRRGFNLLKSMLCLSHSAVMEICSFHVVFQGAFLLEIVLFEE